MADVLSQNEIEALLAEMSAPPETKVAEGRSPVSSSSNSLRTGQRVVLPLSRRRTAALTGRGKTVTYEPYDFKRSDKLSKEHLRTLQVIHEQFARLFTSSLSAYLRTTVNLEVISIEQVTYEEYIKSISSSLINILRVSELSGQIIMEMDMRILFAMIDRLLGGLGEGYLKPGKDLTDVEKVLSTNITRRSLNDLETAWHDIVPLEFENVSIETSSQFVQLVPGNDTVVLILFDLKVGEQRGAMSLSIPYMLLKPVSKRLNTQSWFSSTRKVGKHLAPQMATHLRELTSIPVIARLGTSKISVQDIADMEVGQILPLHIVDADGDDRPARDGIANVDVLICDKTKFRGHIGLRSGKKLAVQIDDVLKPPPELQVHRTEGFDKDKEKDN